MRDVITAAKVRKARRQRPAPVAGNPDDLGVQRQVGLALFEKALDRLLPERQNRDLRPRAARTARSGGRGLMTKFGRDFLVK